MHTTNILQKTVSFQINARSPITQEFTIQSILEDIKNGKYASRIDYLRNIINDQNIGNYNKEKLLLPAVTFCGTFNEKRNRESIKEYNYLLVIDIDKLDEQALIHAKQALNLDAFVFAYWVSPSNNGLKGLIQLAYDKAIDIRNIDYNHKQAFNQVFNHFQRQYSITIDSSGSDTTRLCFISYDPLIEIKENFEVFEVSTTDVSTTDAPVESNTIPTEKIRKEPQSDRDRLFNPADKNNPIHRVQIQSIIRYLKKRNLSITESYPDWLKVALAISNSFTHDIGEKYFLSLSKNDTSKFNETASIAMLLSCYGSSKQKINFQSIIFLAEKLGYKSKSLRKGVSSEGGVCKNVASFSIT